MLNGPIEVMLMEGDYPERKAGCVHYNKCLNRFALDETSGIGRPCFGGAMVRTFSCRNCKGLLRNETDHSGAGAIYKELVYAVIEQAFNDIKMVYDKVQRHGHEVVALPMKGAMLKHHASYRESCKFFFEPVEMNGQKHSSYAAYYVALVGNDPESMDTALTEIDKMRRFIDIEEGIAKATERRHQTRRVINAINER